MSNPEIQIRDIVNDPDSQLIVHDRASGGYFPRSPHGQTDPDITMVSQSDLYAPMPVDPKVRRYGFTSTTAPSSLEIAFSEQTALNGQAATFSNSYEPRLFPVIPCNFELAVLYDTTSCKELTVLTVADPDYARKLVSSQVNKLREDGTALVELSPAGKVKGISQERTQDGWDWVTPTTTQNAEYRVLTPPVSPTDKSLLRVRHGHGLIHMLTTNESAAVIYELIDQHPGLFTRALISSIRERDRELIGQELSRPLKAGAKSTLLMSIAE